MKQIITAIAISLILSTCSHAIAEPVTRNKPVQCAPPIEVINEYIMPNELDVMYIAVANILTQWQESELAAVSFWMNVETGKFLFLEGNKEQVCVISLGDRMDFSIQNDDVLGLYLQDSM